jgi:hypothetical protein
MPWAARLAELITKLSLQGFFWREIMLFMLVSHARPGTKREQLVERLARQLHFETWDLVRQGVRLHREQSDGNMSLQRAVSF